VNVFLDTNVLLGLYKLTGPDLEEVRRLIALAENKKFDVYINENVVDEFWRNREKVIAGSMNHLETIRRGHAIPNLVKPYPEAAKLRETAAAVAKAAEALGDVAHDDIANYNLKADQIVNELFKKFKPKALSESAIAKALRRQEFGRPPGKSGSIGDALNWEWLLEIMPEGVDLHIISADGDYESELYPSVSKDYLAREWSSAKKSELHLHKSLLDFLQKCFPEFKLADEVEKVIAIQRLVESFSFAETHKAIQGLQQYGDFSDEQLIKMLTALNENSQISWILGDGDVKPFAEKLVGIAKSAKALEAAAPVKEKLAKIEENGQALGEIFGVDDDIPF
jgi:predicted nucleic acid-binding protein